MYQEIHEIKKNNNTKIRKTRQKQEIHKKS